MAKRLTDNLTSKYYEAYNRLGSKNARKRIIAYVESFDDVFFWRTVLRDLENDKCYFEIMLPSRNKLTKGKKTVLKNKLFNQIGEGMIACVDADYDYLMQGATSTSKYILSNPYVFHTYVYAIENYQCYAPSLHDACVMATLNDKVIFDFERMLKDFSEICFPLFVWSVWAYRTNNHATFSLTNFASIATLGHANISNTGAQMHHLKEKVHNTLRWLNRKFPDKDAEISSLSKELLQLGVTPQTTYLYIQGHHLFDNIISPIVNKISSSLRRERETEIKNNALHFTQLSNELASYEHSIQDVKNMLRRNVGYKDSPEFKRLQNDIRTTLKLED